MSILLVILALAAIIELSFVIFGDGAEVLIAVLALAVTIAVAFYVEGGI